LKNQYQFYFFLLFSSLKLICLFLKSFIFSKCLQKFFMKLFFHLFNFYLKHFILELFVLMELFFLILNSSLNSFNLKLKLLLIYFYLNLNWNYLTWNQNYQNFRDFIPFLFYYLNHQILKLIILDFDLIILHTNCQ